MELPKNPAIQKTKPSRSSKGSNSQLMRALSTRDDVTQAETARRAKVATTTTGHHDIGCRTSKSNPQSSSARGTGYVKICPKYPMRRERRPVRAQRVRCSKFFAAD